LKKALITGITGQDGSYLAELLLSKGYEVHGIIRRASTFNTQRIDHIYVDTHDRAARLFLHYGDLTDAGLITDIVYNVRPEEIYHLGAQSHVRVSFDLPEFTGDVTGLGATRILEAIRRSNVPARFYQASSSEMFGLAPSPQGEQTAFAPRSPYGIAKVYAYWMAVNYREAYNVFACNGILFNHESPRRGETFVTRKITRALANILAGNQKRLFLGNLQAQRDWGFAPEYVEVMWKMLQVDRPEDFVIGSGESHSVREFLERAFAYAGVEVEWRGEGKEEKGLVRSCADRWKSILKAGDVVVEIDPNYFRPTEVDMLRADISKAKRELGWEPRFTFLDLIKIMVDYDMLSIGLTPPKEGVELLEKRDLAWTSHRFSFHQNIRNEAL
jgi:GDPmannose 4,6-dehydratase